jgi:hypothetical protein
MAAGTAAPAPPAYGESEDGDFEIHMDRIGRELQCRICMAAYDDAMVTRCDHYFCATCITSSIQHKKRCPLCKAPVTRRELRVDERMRALVKTYRAVLASHRMKNAYCSQLPASARLSASQDDAKTRTTRRRLRGEKRRGHASAAAAVRNCLRAVPCLRRSPRGAEARGMGGGREGGPTSRQSATTPKIFTKSHSTSTRQTKASARRRSTQSRARKRC